MMIGETISPYTTYRTSRNQTGKVIRRTAPESPSVDEGYFCGVFRRRKFFAALYQARLSLAECCLAGFEKVDEF